MDNTHEYDDRMFREELLADDKLCMYTQAIVTVEDYISNKLKEQMPPWGTYAYWKWAAEEALKRLEYEYDQPIDPLDDVAIVFPIEILYNFRSEMRLYLNTARQRPAEIETPKGSIPNLGRVIFEDAVNVADELILLFV